MPRNKKNLNLNETAQTDAESIEEITNNEEPIEEETNTVPEPAEKVFKSGVVCSCERLNVRKDPSYNNPPICELPKGTKLNIDIDESVDGWYKVNASGVEGFCVKNYINIY